MMEAYVFKNIPFARTGLQNYLHSELHTDSKTPFLTVPVYRDKNQVRASANTFDFVPLTNDHPSDFVGVDNLEQEAIGILVNPYFDEASEQLKADFIVWDELAIADIQSGKRQLSGGYECDYKQINGRYEQTDIIGNHVALCAEGRSGAAQAFS
ncbi:DUF2213 domain-containing protein [Vibrio rumoiensis]|uniref:DUF2213 domain-containing protein n=1 Tax=Vibrio rumoiensis TaxID=76258 RepID=A0ABW7J0E5_9VIBR